MTVSWRTTLSRRVVSAGMDGCSLLPLLWHGLDRFDVGGEQTGCAAQAWVNRVPSAAIKVRGLVIVAALAVEVRHAKVIREDEDDVARRVWISARHKSDAGSRNVIISQLLRNAERLIFGRASSRGVVVRPCF